MLLDEPKAKSRRLAADREDIHGCGLRNTVSEIQGHLYVMSATKPLKSMLFEFYQLVLDRPRFGTVQLTEATQLGSPLPRFRCTVTCPHVRSSGITR